MALTISQFATGSTTTAVTSITISSLTASVGDMLIVAIASDNSATGGTSPISSVTDSAGNSWTSRNNLTASTGNIVNDGVSLRVFNSILTSSLSSGSITVNFSTSTSNANILIWRVQPGAGQTLITRTSPSSTLNGTGTTAVRSTVGYTADVGDYNFGFIATEKGGAFTADTSSAYSWSSNYVSNTASETPIASQFTPMAEGSNVNFNPSWATSTDYVAGRFTIGVSPITKIYLPSSSATPSLSPSVDSGWDKSSDVDRILASKTKMSTTRTTVTATKSVNDTAYDIVRRQYLLGPLAAQTIQGAVLGAIRVGEDSASADASSQMSIRVVSEDGTTVRGTALALSSGALSSEWNPSTTTYYPRYFPLRSAIELAEPANLDAVTASAGDYLVIEIGVRGREASATSRTFYWRFGDAATADISIFQTDSATDYNPIIKFLGTTLPLLTTVTPTTATLSLTSYALTVTATSGPAVTTVTPATSTLTATAYAPTVTATANQTATPGTSSLAATSYAPTVTATDNQTSTPKTAALSLTAFSPSVTATENVTSEPVAASLAVTPQLAEVSATANVPVEIATAALVLTNQAPAVSTSTNQVAAPASVGFALTCFAPDVTASDNQTVVAATASLTVAPTAPQLIEAITVATAALTLAAFAPDLREAITVSPATASLVLSPKQAAVRTHVILRLATAALALTQYAPDVVAEQDYPGTAEVTLSLINFATLSLSAATAAVDLRLTGEAALTLS